LAPALLALAQICHAQDLLVTPSSGPAGGVITITGKGFGVTAGTVTFQGIRVKPESWSDSEIEVISPNACASLPVLLTVEVKNKAGEVKGTAAFTESPPQLMPSSGPGGTTLKIMGPRFGSLKGNVTFGKIAIDPANIKSWTDGEVDVVVPNADANQDVSLKIEIIDFSGKTAYSGLFIETPTEHAKQIPLVCASDKGNKEPVSCKGKIIEITVAKPKELYSNVASAIVQLREGRFGFPADIVAGAFDLAPPKSSFSFRPWRFRKLSLIGELQSVKDLGPIQGSVPTLVTADVFGKRPQIFPSEYVRALFLTQLFPEKVEIVKSRQKAQLLTSPLYIILDSNYVDEAKMSLQNLANQDDHDSIDLAQAAVSSRSNDQSPRLIQASLHTDAQAGQGSSPKKGSSVQIAEWFPQISVEKLSVQMEVVGNHWKCGPWEDANGSPLNPIPSRLKEVGSEGGCVLNIQIDMSHEIGRVYKYITIAGWFSDPFACWPADYPPKAEAGVSVPRCGTGQLRWGIEENRISHSTKAPTFQLAVPYFDLKTPPKIMLGLAGVLNLNFISPRDKSCWCSPKACDGQEQDRCIVGLDR
jgi:hypothetical protein